MMSEKKRNLVSVQSVHRSKVLELLQEGAISRIDAALSLELSERQVSRISKKFVTGGLLALEHGLIGRISGNAHPEDFHLKVMELARGKYPDFNAKHMTEFLSKKEKIEVGYSTLKSWLKKEDLGKTRRRSKKIRKKRPRFACIGILFQMDGSDHEWIKGQRWSLIAGIDDASSEVPYGEFFKTESMEGYLNVLRRVFESHGMPQVLYVDRAGWLSGTATEEDSGQFKRMMTELGITVIFALSPQAKGRIERLWRTFQDRLIAEFRLSQVKTMEEGNAYLNEIFLPETWNKMFTVVPGNSESKYLKPPTKEHIDHIFCIKYERKVRNDHTILWGNRQYLIKKELTFSLAKRIVEIRINPKSHQVNGFHGGMNLELELVETTSDREAKSPIGMPGLLTKVPGKRGRPRKYEDNV
jgi:transposase